MKKFRKLSFKSSKTRNIKGYDPFDYCINAEDNSLVYMGKPSSRFANKKGYNPFDYCLNREDNSLERISNSGNKTNKVVNGYDPFDEFKMI